MTICELMLKGLIQQAPDLRKVLTAERIREYQAEGAGLRLSYATERLTKEILDGLLGWLQKGKLFIGCMPSKQGKR